MLLHKPHSEVREMTPPRGIVHVRPAGPSDRDPISRLREGLWPETSTREHAREVADFLAGKRTSSLPLAVLVAETINGELVGFVEVGLRSHADGCDPKRPVGFVEGWFVSEKYRRKRIGVQLLAAAENWARSQGCAEMGSDALISSDVSQRAHEACGFEVVDCCVHYRKVL